MDMKSFRKLMLSFALAIAVGIGLVPGEGTAPVTRL